MVDNTLQRITHINRVISCHVKAERHCVDFQPLVVLWRKAFIRGSPFSYFCSYKSE